MITTHNERTFQILWCLACFFHYEWWAINTLPLNLAVNLYLTAILTPLFLFYNYKHLFVLLLMVQVLDAYANLPNIPNHWLLAFIVNSFYLLSVLYAKLKNLSSWAIFSLALVPIVSIFYGFAAFWKLNFDYLFSTQSCSLVFSKEIPIIGFFIFYPLSTLMPWLVLLVEGAISWLLFLKRFKSALALGLCLHFSLSLNIERSFVNFSWVMCALLVGLALNKVTVATEFLRPKTRIFLALITLLIVLWCLLLTDAKFFYTWIRFGLYLILVIVVFTALIKNYLNSNIDKSTEKVSLNTDFSNFDSETTRFRWITVFATVAVLLNGITPIIGLKTGSAWQMYSNLSISTNFSNHLLVPPSFNLFGLMGRPLRVEYRDGKTKTYERLTVMQSCLQAPCDKFLKSVYSLSNEEVSFESLIKDSNKLPWWQKKLVRFLPLNDEGTEMLAECKW